MQRKKHKYDYVPWLKCFVYSCDLLCDCLFVIWTQRIIDEDKILRAVVLNVEKRETDQNAVVFGSSDLPLTTRLGGVTYGVPWRRKFFQFVFFSFQTVETVHWK